MGALFLASVKLLWSTCFTLPQLVISNPLRTPKPTPRLLVLPTCHDTLTVPCTAQLPVSWGSIRVWPAEVIKGSLWSAKALTGNQQLVSKTTIQRSSCGPFPARLPMDVRLSLRVYRESVGWHLCYLVSLLPTLVFTGVTVTVGMWLLVIRSIPAVSYLREGAVMWRCYISILFYSTLLAKVVIFIVYHAGNRISDGKCCVCVCVELIERAALTSLAHKYS